MRFVHYRMLVASLICSAGIFFQAPLLAAAQNHVVSPEQLRETTVSAAQKRQQNISKLQKFFSSKPAEKALKSSGLDPAQVKNAVPTLSSQELARLVSRTDKARQDFAAGALTHRQITLIIIAAAVVIIVIAVA